MSPIVIRRTAGQVEDEPNGPCRQADPDLFFSTDPAKSAAAKAICARCPAVERDKCLRLAIENHHAYGVWGGLTEEERAIFRAGSRITRPRALDIDRRDEIEPLLRGGLTVAEVAAHFGITPAAAQVACAAVRRLADAEGDPIPVPRRPRRREAA